VPPRAALAEGALPCGLVVLAPLPEREVARRFLLVLVALDARAVLELALLDPGEAAVRGKGRDPVIGRTLAVVRQPLVAQALDHLDHLGHVVGGAGVDLRPLYAQAGERLE